MAASLWNPTTNTEHLKLLGKTAEEASELASAASRCLIQGLDEAEPITGKVNRIWLQDEIADVLSCILALQERLNLDREYIIERLTRKYDYHKPWYDHQS